VYRGTTLGSSELSGIQGLIDSHPNVAQGEVARLVCQRFGWRRPNGESPSISCSVFLRQLANQGLLKLPARRTKRRSQHPDKDAAAILDFLGPVAGMVECQPAGPLEVRLVAAEERDGFRLHLQRYHYLGFTKPVGESQCYVALVGGDLVALLVWGAAALHNGPRDSYIGWAGPEKERNLPWVVNNSRFLMLPWIRQPLLASQILGANLRRLSRDWVAAYGHPVLLAETFVERPRFKGICYQASNWTCVGETLGFSRLRSGFVHHGRRKAVFVYPVHRRALTLLRGPLPRTEAAQTIHG
jgi:hypothetical protein